MVKDTSIDIWLCAFILGE